MIAVRAAGRSDRSQAHALYEFMRLLVFSLGVPFSFLALASGLALAMSSRWGVLRYWWVAAKLGLLLATLLVGALATGPSVGRMLDATRAGAAGGLPAKWPLVAAIAAQGTMVTAATALAVFKPSKRLRRAG